MTRRTRYERVVAMPGHWTTTSVGTGVATLASGVNYLLVSGLKPKGRLGKRLMIQRENLQERYREREVLVRERMGVGRERMRVRKVRVLPPAALMPPPFLLGLFCPGVFLV